MVSILRSNQPIAWLIVPATGLFWFLLTIWGTDTAFLSLVIQAIGSLTIASMAHRVYVRYGFVERGDPALAWLSMVLLLLLMPQETLASAARSWLALLLLLAAVDQILQVHRQTSTSGLQFRSGALASLSTMLEPLHFGFVLAMLIVLSISRPFIFREWSMMVIGLVWGIAIAQAVSAFGPDWGVSIRETSETLSLQGYRTRWISPHFTRLWLIVLSVWGGGILLREKTKVSLRAHTTRTHLLILFWVSLLLASLIQPTYLPFVTDDIRIAFRGQSYGTLDKFLAVGAAFGVVGLVPQTRRHRGLSAKADTFRLLVILGSLLILFMPSL